MPTFQVFMRIQLYSHLPQLIPGSYLLYSWIDRSNMRSISYLYRNTTVVLPCINTVGSTGVCEQNSLLKETTTNSTYLGIKPGSLELQPDTQITGLLLPNSQNIRDTFIVCLLHQCLISFYCNHVQDTVAATDLLIQKAISLL